MSDKILIDTSVWIDFFRGGDPARYGRVTSLLREDRAVGTGIVVLELLRGSKTAKEVRVVKDLFDTIETIHPNPATYFGAGDLGRRLAGKGHTIGVVDLLIAQLAVENHLQLFSLDQHFKTIASFTPLSLFEGMP